MPCRNRPQQLKQLLMVAGIERYFQIARCFRDEDQRGDRQPEFTQLDLEMSFVQRDDVLALVEGLYHGHDPGSRAEQETALDALAQALPIRKSMNRYGTDKPDLRFGMELIDVSDIFAKSEFQRLPICHRKRRRDQVHRRARLRRLLPARRWTS